MSLTIVDTDPGSRGAPPDKTKLSFGRHETFHLRDGWLTKGLLAVADDPGALLGKDAHHELGVGINMLKSIRYWIEATGLAQPVQIDPKTTRSPFGLELTWFGELIVGRDRYCEYPGSLWLAHALLAVQRRHAPVWYWAFNMAQEGEFTAEELEHEVREFADGVAARPPAPSTVRRDVRCFIRTYVAVEDGERISQVDDPLGCPLSSLGLLVRSRSGSRYRLAVGPHPSLPVELFLFALYRFGNPLAEAERVIAFDEIRWAPESPGRILCLDSDTIRSLLDNAQETYGEAVARQVRTAGLDLVQLGQYEPEHFLDQYYSTPAEGVAAR